MRSKRNEVEPNAGRRGFLKSASAGLAVAAGYPALAQTPVTTAETVTHAGASRPLSDDEKVKRIASNSYPIRFNFKTRNPSESEEKSKAAKGKYGEITLLDYPAFTKEHFPGVTKMDVWSSLFGNPSDDSMYVQTTFEANGKQRHYWEFDPSQPSSRKWLEQFANKCVTTGTQVHHISNNAPRDIESVRTQGSQTILVGNVNSCSLSAVRKLLKN